MDADVPLEYLNEYLRPCQIRVKEAGHFKTVIGSQGMAAGGRYFFQVKINNGFLIKIGVSRKDIDND